MKEELREIFPTLNISAPRRKSRRKTETVPIISIIYSVYLLYNSFLPETVNFSFPFYIIYIKISKEQFPRNGGRGESAFVEKAGDKRMDRSVATRLDLNEKMRRPGLFSEISALKARTLAVWILLTGLFCVVLSPCAVLSEAQEPVTSEMIPTEPIAESSIAESAPESGSQVPTAENTGENIPEPENTPENTVENGASPPPEESVSPESPPSLESFPSIGPDESKFAGSAVHTMETAPRQPVPPQFKKPIQVEKGITFWLFGDDGNWKIPLPNWSVGDIMRLIDSPGRQEDEIPYTIESLNVRGQVEGETVELTAEYRINTTAESVVRVPLGLREGIYIPDETGDDRSMFQYSGPGECRLDIDRENGGYVAIIRNQAADDALGAKSAPESGPDQASAGANETDAVPEEAAAEAPATPADETFGGGRFRHTVTIRLFFQIETVGGNEYHLKATFAPAVSSKVRLQVPLSDIQLMVSEGALALPPVNLNETTSEIILNGLNRDDKPTEISWWKRVNRSFEVQKILQVEDGVIIAAPDDQQVQYEVTYPIRCFGGRTDQFRIQLPAQSQLVRDSVVVTDSDNAPVAVREVKETVLDIDSSDTETPSALPVVEIRLAQEVQETVVVQFKATAPNPSTGSSTGLAENAASWELGGFSVIGAQKQYGRMSVRLPKEIAFQMTTGTGIRPSSVSAPASDEESESFTFFAQPFSLSARTIVRRASMSVSPEYQIQVHPGHIQLQARFEYAVHGGMIRELRMRFADWFVSQVKPENVIDTEKMYTDQQTGELVLPLQVPSEGPVQISLTASREMVLNQELLELPIPIPIADWIEPASVVIVPDDNIELVPVVERLVDLLPKGVRSLNLSIEIPSRQQVPLVYQAKRFSGGGGNFPLFVSAILFHDRKVDVKADTEVQLTDDPLSDFVRQTWNYAISYQALKGVSLLVPADLKENSSFTLTVDGKEIPAQEIATEPMEGAEEGRVRKKITFPDGERIGNCSMTLGYACRKIELVPDMTNRITLELAVPEDGTLSGQRLTVKTRPGVLIETPATAEGGWTTEEKRGVPTGSTREYRFSTNEKSDRILLRAVVSGQDALGTTVVERVWIQTWLAAGNRFERLSARVVSDRDRFLVKLPTTVRRDRVEIRLDGKPYPETTGGEGIYTPSGEMIIRVADEQKRRPMTLEISYLIQPDPNSVAGDITLPVFTGQSVWVRRCYWQVILPASRHILGTAAGWTPEYYDTTWSGFFFKRLASMGPEELGTWVGVSATEPIPEQTNVYLFGSFSPGSQVKLRFVERSTLIFVGSGAMLILGLAFLYFPVTRYQGTLLFLILLAVAVFVYSPVVILIFLQTTVFGVVLTLAALLMKRLLRQRASTEPILPERPQTPEPASEISNASHSAHWTQESVEPKSNH